VTKPTGLIHILIGALAFQGVSGVGGGVGLVVDPSGEALGIPAGWLEGSPFPDYLVPGIVLFTALGVAPLVACYGVWKRRRWARAAAVLVGLALLVWIAVEIAVIGYQPQPPLQLVYGFVGASILALALLPAVRAELRHRAGTR
jgi:peptidoglycan/LPS O-acetylase OafA/YrhL